MNRYYRSGIANVLNTSVSLLLFMMFTVCVLLLIGAAADTYSGINKGYEETYGSAATVRYLSNKIRAADSCEIIGDGSGVALTSGRMLTVVYLSDGALYEKSVAAGSEPAAFGGEMIFELDSLMIEDSGSLYRIEVAVDGSSSQVLIRKG